MKRLLLVCLILALALSMGGCAMLEQFTSSSSTPSEPKFASLEKALLGYLDSQNYKYHHDEEKDYIYFNMTMQTADFPDGCDVYLSYDEEGFLAEAFLPLQPDLTDAKVAAGVNELMTRANYALNLGKFQMNYEDGEISYMTSAKYFERIPSQQELEWLVDIPSLMIDKYGNAFKHVIEDGADPVKEFEAADAQEQPEPGLTMPKDFVLPR